jgi:putative serine protease PepD
MGWSRLIDWRRRTGWRRRTSWRRLTGWRPPSGWPRRPGPGLALLAIAAGVVACSGGGGGTSGASSSPSASASASASPARSLPAAGGPATLQQQYERVVASVLPSVVQITTSEGLGSGVVFDRKGDIVTNAHVVGSAKNVQVRLSSTSKTLAARVLGVFAPDDLAVIRVQNPPGTMRPATFGRSSAVRVGEIVLAMGNPLGLTGTVTDGIVSATGRTVSEGEGSSAVLISTIQTSAAINPGNSGGALVSLSGQVIGIPTLAASDPQMGGAAVGIGFAIPSDTVTSIAPQLIATGKVTNSGRAALGVTVETVANAGGQPAGVGVVSVMKGGPADQAGIRAGDVIHAVNGQPTNSVTELQSALAGLKPGDQVRVRLSRNGTKSTVTATLGTLTG